jgi:chromosome segregation ATPase
MPFFVLIFMWNASLNCSFFKKGQNQKIIPKSAEQLTKEIELKQKREEKNATKPPQAGKQAATSLVNSQPVGQTDKREQKYNELFVNPEIKRLTGLIETQKLVEQKIREENLNLQKSSRTLEKAKEKVEFQLFQKDEEIKFLNEKINLKINLEMPLFDDLQTSLAKKEEQLAKERNEYTTKVLALIDEKAKKDIEMVGLTSQIKLFEAARNVGLEVHDIAFDSKLDELLATKKFLESQLEQKASKIQELEASLKENENASAQMMQQNNEKIRELEEKITQDADEVKRLNKRDQEDSQLILNLDNNLGEIKQLNRQLNEEVKRYQDILHEKDEALEAQKKELAQLTQTIDKRATTIQNLETKISEKEKSIQDLKINPQIKDVNFATEQQQKVTSELNVLKETNKSLRIQLQEKQILLDEKNRLETKRDAIIKEQAERIKQLQDSNHNRIESIKKDNEGAVLIHEEDDQKSAFLEDEILNLKSELLKKVQTIANLKQEIVAEKSKDEQLRESAELQKIKQELKSTKEALNEAQQKINQELESTKKALNEAQKEIKDLPKTSKEQNQEQLRAELQAAQEVDIRDFARAATLPYKCRLLKSIGLNLVLIVALLFWCRSGIYNSIMLNNIFNFN